MEKFKDKFPLEWDDFKINDEMECWNDWVGNNEFVPLFYDANKFLTYIGDADHSKTCLCTKKKFTKGYLNTRSTTIQTFHTYILTKGNIEIQIDINEESYVGQGDYYNKIDIEDYRLNKNVRKFKEIYSNGFTT